MLVRYNQFPRLWDNMLDNFFRGDVLDTSAGQSTWTPAVDIVEQENEYLVNLELPGIKKEDVKITVENNYLTIRGERKREHEVKEDNFYRFERSYGTFERSFRLPNTVKADRIDASYKDGVLTVSLPKAEEAKPKQIEVKVK